MTFAASLPLVCAGQVPMLYLDANVLLPQYLRSVFLDLADAELVAVHWGHEVLTEVRRNLLRPRFGKTPAEIDRLFADMARAFPAALVQDSRGLEARFAGKTDAGDAHVAAGALKLSFSVDAGQSVVLVTSNLKHLPQAAFAGTAVRSVRPGTFLKALLEIQPAVADVLDKMIGRFTQPAMEREDLLAVLDRSGCKAFATALGDAWGFEQV